MSNRIQKTADSMRQKDGTDRASGSLRRNTTSHILDAAEKVFSCHGFSGARIDEIARVCELPKANVLYYFSTKEKLYQATLERFLDGWLADADVWISEKHSPYEGLLKYVQAKIVFSRRKPEVSRLFMQELLSGGGQIEDFLSITLKEHVERLSHVFKVWQERGEMKAVNVPHFMFMLWSMTQSYADMQVQFAAVLGRKKLIKSDFDDGLQTIMQLLSSVCTDAGTSVPEADRTPAPR
ncbi:TetR family transcriptional regulator C-terminal domain-containing protein [Acetobacter sp.]|uniref:TetR family transcriptional regulator C-terminal domain-containing protein n=1 Tax=Acetobacter sp. TaxID=440 RepID=UPI0039EBF166